MRVSFRDLPDHGLLLTDPLDPFSEKNTESWMRKLAPLAHLIPDSCIALLNESNQRLISYKLIWHLESATGAAQVDEKSFANVEELMGLSHAEIDYGTSVAIEAGDFRVFSTINRMPVEIESRRKDSGGIQTVVGGDVFQEFASETPSYVRATVTLDGAFYSNGIFVGPDETHYFEVMRAKVNAKFDLLKAIDEYVKRGQPLIQLFEQLGAQPRPKYGPNMTPKEVYQLYQAIFADEALALKNGRGEPEAMREWSRDLNREWPKLRKISDVSG